MRKVLFEVALWLSKVVAIMIGTRSIDVEAAADLGAQRGPPFRASNLSLVPTTPSRTDEIPYFLLLDGK